MSSESTASAGGYYPGIGAMAFWLLASGTTLLFAAELAADWRQFPVYALIGLSTVIVLIGMPAIAVLKDPGNENDIGGVWPLTLVIVAFLGLFLARIEPADIGGRAAQLQASLDYLGPDDWQLRRATVPPAPICCRAGRRRRSSLLTLKGGAWEAHICGGFCCCCSPSSSALVPFSGGMRLPPSAATPDMRRKTRHLMSTAPMKPRRLAIPPPPPNGGYRAAFASIGATG